MIKNHDKKWDEAGISSLLRDHAPKPPHARADLEENLMRAIKRQQAKRVSIYRLFALLKLPPFSPRMTAGLLAAAALLCALAYGIWRENQRDFEGHQLQLAQIEQANEVLALSLDYGRNEDDSYLKNSVDNIFGRY